MKCSEPPPTRTKAPGAGAGNTSPRREWPLSECIRPHRPPGSCCRVDDFPHPDLAPRLVSSLADAASQQREQLSEVPRHTDAVKAAPQTLTSPGNRPLIEAVPAKPVSGRSQTPFLPGLSLTSAPGNLWRLPHGRLLSGRGVAHSPNESHNLA